MGCFLSSFNLPVPVLEYFYQRIHANRKERKIIGNYSISSGKKLNGRAMRPSEEGWPRQRKFVFTEIYVDRSEMGIDDVYYQTHRLEFTQQLFSNNGNNLRPGICYRNATGNPFPLATPFNSNFRFSLPSLFVCVRGTSRGSLYNSFLSLLQHNGGYEAQPKNVNTISRSKQQQQQQVKKNKISLFFLFSFFYP